MKLRTVSTRRIVCTTAILVLACAAVAALSGYGHATSLLAGGAFMIADFHLIRMFVSRLIKPGVSSAAPIVLLTLKFFLVIVLIVGVFYQFPIAPMSFAFGASLLLLAAVLEAVALGRVVDTPQNELGTPDDLGTQD